MKDLADEVAFSAGSACRAGATTCSAVLKAMGMDDDWGMQSVLLPRKIAHSES